MRFMDDFCFRVLLSRCSRQEIKNGHFGAWCSMMTAGGYARVISHEHLPVGHTHEDIGFLANLLKGIVQVRLPYTHIKEPGLHTLSAR